MNDIRKEFFDNLQYVQGRLLSMASKHDLYMACAYTVRNKMLLKWLESTQIFLQKDIKVVAYFSAEFLLGPHLINNLLNMGRYEEVKGAIERAGYSFEELAEQEEEPGLGNGGLGRLAACYMDSMATLQIPAIGYGIRYEFGIFRQEIQNGWQVEKSDKWQLSGNPWELARPQISVEVKFGGHTERKNGRVVWVADRIVKGIPYDTPITGFQQDMPNILRLWKAEAHESFDFQAFNVGDYYKAVAEKMASENISKVLYPNDEPLVGRKLRLEQQYFFVSCSLQDIVRIHKLKTADITQLPDHFACQLNDTHPSVAIPELMRLLVDEEGVAWEQAWDITVRTFAYTNHTLLPEALEKWPLKLFGELLPRHLEIIYEINRRFLEGLRGANQEQLRNLSLIEEEGEKYVRMAHLAVIGSHRVNGVAELHSKLLKEHVLKDLYDVYPERFTNITNGVTPRRWLGVANPPLTRLLNETLGTEWMTDLSKLSLLEKHLTDTSFCQAWRQVKQGQKGHFSHPEALFDVQVKRIHEYKRQHLNVLYIVARYLSLKNNPSLPLLPRHFIFGGKAAPGYHKAKLIIKLINTVAEIVNNDPATNGKLHVTFIPNFNVKMGQQIYPVADLSEQISLSGKEASGTGNMKFMLNGALTIGTLDGANIEILEAVGHENFFLFGMTAEEVFKLSCHYNPETFIQKSPELKAALEFVYSLENGLFKALFSPDPFMVCADFASYSQAQTRADALYQNTEAWTRASILNVARCGKFSSDRAIMEYGEKIWNVAPYAVYQSQ